MFIFILIQAEQNRSHVVEKQYLLTDVYSVSKQVYEDKSQGIVCYQDDRGEIICEGYDEGPCFQRIPKPTYHPR